jgi:hypothetical protein
MECAPSPLSLTMILKVLYDSIPGIPFQPVFRSVLSVFISGQALPFTIRAHPRKIGGKPSGFSDHQITGSPDQPISGVSPPIPIPDWRGFQRHHPKSSQIGAGFRDQACIGVGFIGLPLRSLASFVVNGLAGLLPGFPKYQPPSTKKPFCALASSQ